MKNILSTVLGNITPMLFKNKFMLCCPTFQTPHILSHLTLAASEGLSSGRLHNLPKVSPKEAQWHSWDLSSLVQDPSPPASSFRESPLSSEPHTGLLRHHSTFLTPRLQPYYFKSRGHLLTMWALGTFLRHQERRWTLSLDNWNLHLVSKYVQDPQRPSPDSLADYGPRSRITSFVCKVLKDKEQDFCFPASIWLQYCYMVEL